MSSVGTTYSAYEDMGLAVQKKANGKGGSTQLGQQDFLELMTAQLQHQDPFKPSDNGEFIAQMAQFSSMNSIQEMEKSFKSMAESMLASQALQASTLVGRQVMVPSGYGTLSEWAELGGSFELPNHAQNVTVGIYDTRGQLMTQFSLGEQDAGQLDFYWDGSRDDGTMAQPGLYEMRVQSYANGKSEELDTLARVQVGSVTLDKGAASINVDMLGSFDLADVKEIR